MPLSEMDYAEELHAQAAAKERERQQAKLLERAENLQHMAALAGDAGAVCCAHAALPIDCSLCLINSSAKFR